MLGYGSADELAVHGGVEALFGDEAEQGRAAIPTRRVLRADGSGLDLVTALRTIRWRGATAFMLTLRTPDVSDGDNEAPPTLPADALLDILPLGVLSLAGDGTVHSANAKAGELLGLDVDGLIGASLTALLCEPHRRDVLDDLHALMRGELRPARPVIGLGSAQTAARQAPEAARAAPDLDLTLRRLDLGGGYGLVALLQDARQRKADQEARARAEAELSRLHKERGAFLKRISHELRTPLNAIVGFSEVMMEERFGTLGSVRYRDYAHDIQESGRRLIGMIGDLMDLVRLQEGQDAEESGEERIALNEIVTACVSNVYGRAGERRVIIRCSLAQGLPPVRADRESLSQIVSNLLDNSVRLTQPGGQVIVSTSPLEDGGVAVRVRDGARLDAAALKAAVSPFDLELETTPADGAPSLGLPLTRALAQANGADFTIDSEAGRGTVTQVLFPPERVIAA
ncbi:MAG: histidine kinase dimerization/phospho-acceptor domain-containing protein, partial [Pseudomonadota bacterium]